MAVLSGGAKLEAYLKGLSQKVSNNALLRVGFLENATYPDGTPVAMVAAANEFGTDKIPARPFFRGMIADKADGWGPALGENLKNTDFDVDQSLGLVGEGIKGQLQEAIIAFEGAPLAASTVAAKGSSVQLIETGHMLNSVDDEVVSE